MRLNKMHINEDIDFRKRTILALSQTRDIGYYSIRKLYEFNNRVEEIIDYNLDNLILLFNKAGINYADRRAKNFYFDKKNILKKVDDIITDLTQRNVSFILENESSFPQPLKIIPDNPYWIFVEGNSQILNYQKIVAVVGTRNPTEKGIKITKELTKFLVNNDYIIVSGLAEGIDETAHAVTNELNGKGIAILGCGINIPFPAKTFRIRKELIEKSGAVISEYMIDASYSKKSFFWRNRLQAGLSSAIFPIQGRIKSGTAHTVDFAKSQNKIVIGVYLDEIEPVIQNELLIHLESKKIPVFNLNGDTGKILNFIQNSEAQKKGFDQLPLFISDETKEKIPEVKETERSFWKKLLWKFKLIIK